MSLYRQMWLVVLFAMLLAFGASLATSLLGARSYIQSLLESRNADAAAALALSMSQLPKDRMTLELQAATLFEEGQFEAIRVRALDGALLVDLDERRDGDSRWLERVLALAPHPGRADVADGPRRYGSVEVESQRDGAYRQLETIALHLLAVFAAAALVAGVLAATVLRRLQMHLQAMVAQANAITERRYVVQPVPRTPELAAVVRAQNGMVARVQAMLEEQAIQISRLRDAASCDGLTGLLNRNAFLAWFDRRAGGQEACSGGVLLLLRVRALSDLNRMHGRAASDALLQKLAQACRDLAQGHEQGTAARLNGADFVVLLDGDVDLGQQAAALRDGFRAAVQAAQLPDTTACAIGAAFHRAGESAAVALARVDEALVRAEHEGGCAICVQPRDQEVVRSGTQWREALEQALAQQQLHLVSFPVRSPGGTLLHRECFARIRIEGEAGWLPAARFLPQLVRAGLCSRFDIAVAQQVLDEIVASGEPRALNLNAESLRDTGFAPGLLAALDRQPAAAAQLWVELPDAALRNPAPLVQLAAALRQRGSRVGIERFGGDFSVVGTMQEIGPDYVRLDARFVRHLDSDAGHRAFLQAVTGMLHALGSMVIADGVASEGERTVLLEIGVDGLSGAAISNKT